MAIARDSKAQARRAVRARALARVAAAIVAVGATPCWAWRVNFPSIGVATLDGAGNVFAARSVSAGRSSASRAVTKVSGRTGRIEWTRSYKVPGPEHSDEIRAMSATADGDFVTAGTVEVAGLLTFDVTRLAGRSGRVRWRRTIAGLTQDPVAAGSDEAMAMVLDAAGDVIAAGSLTAASAPQYHGFDDFAVVKLDGRTGDVRWRYQRDGAQQHFDSATHVGVDGAGDVLAAGVFSDLPLGSVNPPSIVKLRGTDGQESWRAHVDLVDGRAFVVDPAGDALIAGTASDSATGNAFGVTKVSGTTGATLWTARISEPVSAWQAAFALRVLPNGDVAAVGFVGSLRDASSLLVAAFDGATGAERWRWSAQGDQGFGQGSTITVAGTELLVTGQVRNDVSCYDILVARLDGVSGRLLGRRILDGTETAALCDDPCERDCGSRPHVGSDMDAPSDALVRPDGRVVLAGFLSDRRSDGRPVTRGVLRMLGPLAAIVEE